MDDEYMIEQDEDRAWKLSWADPISWGALLVINLSRAVMLTGQGVLDSLNMHMEWQKERDDFARDAGRAIEAITTADLTIKEN